jgi:hypothetical protein
VGIGHQDDARHTETLPPVGGLAGELAGSVWT